MKDSTSRPQLQPDPKATVLVAGDVMLDRYLYGETTRISPEAPVPVVHVQASEERPGGAANVAANVRALGTGVRLAGVVGADAEGAALLRQLESLAIDARLLTVADAATVVKVRVLSRHQQLIRLDYESALPISRAQEFASHCAGLLDGVACLVLSDYAKGALQCVPEVIAAARRRSLPVLVDPKSSEFSRYRGATLLTPNSREFQAVAGSWRDDRELADKARALCGALQCDAILVTRGESGMTLVRAGGDALHLPAAAHEVFDVTGAGDTVIATVAAALVAGVGLDDAVRLANTAAGIVVQKLGAAAVTTAELNWHATATQRGDEPIVDRQALLMAVAAARRRGERIVMTNGCFDLLHAGHVQYLEQAARLGDRLLVAINDDDSVRRLKGSDRPVNTLPDRLRVLAGLAAVDWVCPFAEDTPEELIRAVKPDVLVKGGDYREEQVAGAAWVRGHGGAVRILPYVEGSSTSAVIGAIRAAGRD